MEEPGGSFSPEHLEWLQGVGVATPRPDDALWHPSIEALLRVGFYVGIIDPGGGDVWVARHRLDTFNTFGVLIVGSEAEPGFHLGFRFRPKQVWRDELEFLEAAGVWLVEREPEP